MQKIIWAARRGLSFKKGQKRSGAWNCGYYFYFFLRDWTNRSWTRGYFQTHSWISGTKQTRR